MNHLTSFFEFQEAREKAIIENEHSMGSEESSEEVGMGAEEEEE